MARWMPTASVTREILDAAKRTVRAGIVVPTPRQLAGAVRRIRYQPDPGRRVASWPEVLARGYGACADAAALGVASAIVHGQPATLVYDHSECPDGAFHVVAVIGEPGRAVEFDPWPMPASCRIRDLTADVVRT